MKIILCPNPFRDKGLKTAGEAQRLLTAGGASCEFCFPFPVEAANLNTLPSGIKIKEMKAELPDANFLVCFGGDGTILHAAKDASSFGVPIIGVNMGSVGFMAELEHGELSLLSRLAGGKFGIERRMMLDVSVRREGHCVFSDQALNDAVLTKGAVARVLDLEVTGDRVVISSFAGDGLVVATPTGSTAYSMAAGGPIVEPTAENIIIAPICAHSLHAKPFVLGANRTVGVRLAPGGKKAAYLSVDGGRAFRVQPGDWVECRRSRQATQLVKLTGRSFYERINQKLGKA